LLPRLTREPVIRQIFAIAKNRPLKVTSACAAVKRLFASENIVTKAQSLALNVEPSLRSNVFQARHDESKRPSQTAHRNSWSGRNCADTASACAIKAE